MYCEKCGSHIKERSNFCESCGTKVNRNKEVKNLQPSKLRTKVSYELEYDLKEPVREQGVMRKRFLILWLIFFFPVGLFFMWKQRHFNKPVRIIISIFFLFATIIGSIPVNETNITFVKTSKIEFGYNETEPDYKTYFLIEENGEDIEVTNEMISENIDTSELGTYHVTITYVNEDEETHTKTISVKVVENELYLDLFTVRVFCNPNELSTSFNLLSSEPDWKDYFSIRAYGEDILITDDMITADVDFSSKGEGKVELVYQDGSVMMSDAITVEVVVDSSIEELMDIGFTYLESLDHVETLNTMGINKINKMVPKTGDSIDGLKAYEVTLNDEFVLLMTFENRGIFYLGKGPLEIYNDIDGVKGHISEFDVEDESYYVQQFESLGFVEYNGNFLWKSPQYGSSIYVNTIYGSQVVHEYESNKDGTLWSHYVNENIGYIDRISMEEACEYDLENNVYLSDTTCSNDDLEFLLLMVSLYDRDVNNAGLTQEELQRLIINIKLSRLK